MLPLSPSKGDSKREFLHLALPFVSSLQVIVDISNIICGLNIVYLSLQTTNCPCMGRGHGHVTSNFWKISDNISKTVRDSLIVSIELE